jgi:phosphate starvation-inducible PhoH-like protein
MTKRALKRLVREGEFDAAQFSDEAKIRRLPVGRGWSPLRQGMHAEEERDQGYIPGHRQGGGGA